MDNAVGDKIRKARESKAMTQEEMAELLGMSRPTYISLEKGSRDMRISELNRTAAALGKTPAEFLGEDRNNRKFEQMMVYILRKYDDGVPKTKLAKLLYLADFANFYLKAESISGVHYIRRDYGPVADVFFETIDRMHDGGKVGIEPAGKALMISSTSFEKNDSLLSADDKKILDKIDEYWHDKNTQEIVKFTHEQKPWMACLDGEDIPYTIIIQENPDNVYAPIDIYK